MLKRRKYKGASIFVSWLIVDEVFRIVGPPPTVPHLMIPLHTWISRSPLADKRWKDLRMKLNREDI